MKITIETDKIAEIIRLNLTTGWVGEITDRELFIMRETEQKLKVKYAEKFADYFEKEAEIETKTMGILHRKDWDREQFLKKVGVE